MQIPTWFRSLFRPYPPPYPNSRHYSAKKRRFFNTPPTESVLPATTLHAMLQLLFTPQRYTPPQPLPVQHIDWTAFLSPAPQAKLIWFGHSSVLLRLNGRTLLVDPVFASHAAPLPLMFKRFQAPPAALHELPPIDAVFYSHNHYDHLDRLSVRHFCGGNTHFFVPPGMAHTLQKWGVGTDKISELDWWQSIDWHGIRLHAVPARHSSGRSLHDGNRSLWTGWVWQCGGESIYFSGDSSYGAHFAEIGRRFGGFDLALIENGQYHAAWRDNHMFPEQTVQAAADVHARCLMPVHWGMFALAPRRWNESVCTAVAAARAHGLRTLTPQLGEIVSIDSDTRDWWHDIV